jgi:hypothetical protein
MADAHAEEVSLQIIISSTNHTEVLMMQEDGGRISWHLVMPQQLRTRAVSDPPTDPYRGELQVDEPQVRGIFENIVAKQRASKTRREPGLRGRSVALMLKSEESCEVTLGLNKEECQQVAQSQLLSLVQADLRRNYALLKPHHMLDFFYHDNAPRSEVIVKEPHVQHRKSPSDD